MRYFYPITFLSSYSWLLVFFYFYTKRLYYFHLSCVCIRRLYYVLVCLCICNFNDLVNVTFDDILYNLLFMSILSDRKIFLKLLWFQVSSFLIFFPSYVPSVFCMFLLILCIPMDAMASKMRKKNTRRFFCISFLALWADTRFSQLKWSIIPTKLTISGICYIRVCCGVSSFYFAT